MFKNKVDIMDRLEGKIFRVKDDMFSYILNSWTQTFINENEIITIVKSSYGQTTFLCNGELYHRWFSDHEFKNFLEDVSNHHA